MGVCMADLARFKGKGSPYCFNPKLTDRNGRSYFPADNICAFIERLPHVKGPLAGEPIHLEPWQVFILTTVFGWVKPDGKRRFRRSYIEVPRGNAKSTHYENWDTVKRWFAGFWNGMKAHAQTILTFLGPIGWMARIIIAHWQPLKVWFADLVHWLAGKLHGVMNAARSVGHMLGLGSGNVQVHHTSAVDHGAQTTSPLPMRPTSLLSPAQAPSKVEGQVNIKIDGLPPGARVEQVQGGNLRMNVDAGYSGNALGMP